MSLPRAEAALETCGKHLAATGSENTEIDAILTAYASAVIYAVFEAEARSIVATRAAHPGTDRQVTSFSKIAATRLMRSIKVGELAGVAAFFDAGCKTRFHDDLDEECKSAWDAICGNRHGVAHEDGDESSPGTVISNFTFADLSAMYPKAVRVLDALRLALAPPA
jgi:hypothetical protein